MEDSHEHSTLRRCYDHCVKHGSCCTHNPRSGSGPARRPSEATTILTIMTVLLHGIGIRIITMRSDTMKDDIGTGIGSQHPRGLCVDAGNARSHSPDTARPLWAACAPAARLSLRDYWRPYRACGPRIPDSRCSALRAEFLKLRLARRPTHRVSRGGLRAFLYLSESRCRFSPAYSEDA